MYYNSETKPFPVLLTSPPSCLFGHLTLSAGYATESKPEVAKKFGFGPCVVVPTVAKAYEKTQVYLAALKPKDRDELMAMVGRRR